jgi:hypothetical protein
MRTIFVGDIQGCADEFDALLDALAFTRRADRLLLTGDAFARGPEPLRVYRRILDTGAEMVLGNHDWKMLAWMRRQDGDSAGEPPVGKSQRAAVEMMSPVREELKKYLSALPLTIESDAWILVHAALHPEEGLAGTTLEIATSYRTFPGPNRPGAPKWYTLYRGPKTVVFGHDAPGGLVRWPHEGPPLAVGIDTGCVYGGRLTAYHFEADTFHSVPARRVYHPV